MFAAHRNPASAYRRVGTETVIESASPHKLIAMLYDGALTAIATARGAMQRGDIATKGREIGRAVRIVEEGLRGALNLEAGGEVAVNLDALYEYVGRQLTLANLHNDEAALQECVRLLTPVKEAWTAIANDPQVAAA